MTIRALSWFLLLVLNLFPAPVSAATPDAMSRDLLEVRVPQLEQM